MLRRITLLLTATLTTLFSFSQLVMNPNGNITPAQAVQDVLLGAGITANWVTYNGSAANANNVQNPVRQFNSGATNFPMAGGVHMTTQGAPGITDPDLSAIVGGNVTNGTVIEFEFVPDGTLITFNYIFASAEYSGYTCSSFNDGFGFFISGPGINGPFSNNAINIATVPGGNIPVAINTVNSGTPSSGNGAPCAAADPNWQSNSVYFTTSNNPIFTATTLVPNYNGSTTKLPAVVQLQCGETYRIKLAVCNVLDQILDSGVFLEAGSFQSDAVDISISAGNPFSDTLIYRGCSEGVISFDRLSCDLNDTLTVYIETAGSAVPGVDYEALPDSVSFFAGETNITFNIIPLPGGENPEPETIEVTAYFINFNGDTLSATGTIWIVDPPSPGLQALETTLQCFTDSVPIYAQVTVNSFPDYTFTWEEGTVGDTIYADFTENGIYYFPVVLTDGCNTQVLDTAVVIVNQTLTTTTNSIPTPCGLNQGAVVVTASGVTGGLNGVQYQWTGPGQNSSNFFNASAWNGLSSGWYYVTVTDQVCQVVDSAFVDILNPPSANFTVNPNLGYSPLTVNYNNESENASSFYWWFGNGNDLSTDNMGGQTQVFDTIPGVYTAFLVAYEGGCTDTAYATIIILELIPDPQVEVPNVFTPNGDGVNDVWKFIVLQDVAEVDLVITNRWGNVIFQTTTAVPIWDGRDMAGREVSEGVYFYKYKATGLNEKVLEGHGFIQLHR
jgi:gliding motility-associated-like protein